MLTLKVIIAGSRTVNDYTQLTTFIAEIMPRYPGYDRVLIITGGAIGVDLMGKRYAKENKLLYKEFKPRKEHTFDYDAPLRRNETMSKIGDILICLWDSKSRGTQHMMNCMKSKGKPVHVFNCLTNTSTHTMLKKRK